MNIPYFKQHTLYTCGAAVTRMILKYYGIEKSEEKLLKELHITSQKGMSLNKLKDFFAQHGFQINYHSGYKNPDTALSTLEKYINSNVPIIALVNRLEYDTITSLMDNKVEWEGRGFSYHYIVITAVDNSKVYFNDPHKKIRQHSIAKKTFLKAWFHNKIRGEMLKIES